MKKLWKVIRRQRKLWKTELPGQLQAYLPVNAVNQCVGTYDTKVMGDVELLVSTKKGFFLLSGGEIRLLLDGQFFGISMLDDRWYLFQRLSRWSGRVVSFCLGPGGMLDARQVIRGLSPGCHQIDFLDRSLYVTDTYNNRLAIYQQRRQRWGLVGEHFPGGELLEGRDSANYAHMNSIWRSGDDIWLMFHNETKKTGNHSELVRLNAEHRIAERIQTKASNSHNVCILDGEFLYCDSLAGSLVHGSEAVYRSDLFTRGLAVTEDRVFVGESQYGAREIRDQLGGSVAVLDRRFGLLHTIATPGMVQDLRVVNQPDLCMSRTASEAIKMPKRSASV